MNRLHRRLLFGLALCASAFGQQQAPRNAVIAPHAQELVIVQDSKLVPLRGSRFLEAPYTILYFGAGWCPDCRRFSPALVSAYDHQQPGAPRFEVLLVSLDKTREDLLQFMLSEKMKWPALVYDKVAPADELRTFYPSQETPWLSVIDRQGKVVLQSKSDQDAAEVLTQLRALLTKHS